MKNYKLLKNIMVMLIGFSLLAVFSIVSATGDLSSPMPPSGSDSPTGTQDSQGREAGKSAETGNINLEMALPVVIAPEDSGEYIREELDEDLSELEGGAEDSTAQVKQPAEEKAAKGDASKLQPTKKR